MKLSEYAKKIGISYNTAWRMWKKGELDAYQLPSGTVIVKEGASTPFTPKKVVVYVRVSSTENKAGLETQAVRLVNWCNAQGWSVNKVVKECGSGVNDQRPKFLALLADNSISQIVVDNRDRASRFGVAYIQTLLSGQNRQLVIVNEATGGEDDLDLMGDFVAVITDFTARLYGRRRAKRKTEQVLKVLEQEQDGAGSETD